MKFSITANGEYMRSADDRKHCVYTLLPTGATLTTKLKSKNETFFFSFCARAN